MNVLSLTMNKLIGDADSAQVRYQGLLWMLGNIPFAEKAYKANAMTDEKQISMASHSKEKWRSPGDLCPRLKTYENDAKRASAKRWFAQSGELGWMALLCVMKKIGDKTKPHDSEAECCEDQPRGMRKSHW